MFDFLPLSSFAASPTAERMIPAWRMIPMIPAIAIPPIPIGLAYVEKMVSASIAAVTSPPAMPITGTMRNQTMNEPAQITAAYFSPMIYPRPSTAAPVLMLKTVLKRSAMSAPHSQMRVEITSCHHPKLLMMKS